MNNNSNSIRTTIVLVAELLFEHLLVPFSYYQDFLLFFTISDGKWRCRTTMNIFHYYLTGFGCHPLSQLLTWFIWAIFTVAIVIIHLLKGDDLWPIDAQKGLPLPVEPFVWYRMKTDALLMSPHKTNLLNNSTHTHTHTDRQTDSSSVYY